MPSNRGRAYRKRVWKRCKGKCYYCDVEMLWLRPLGCDCAKGHTTHERTFTFEHLDSRINPERGKHAGEFRIVGACLKCNNEKGREEVLLVPIEIRREWAKRHATSSSSSERG